MARVSIPSPLRKFTGDKAEVVVAGGTIAELLTNLEQEFPGIGERICTADGKVRRFINIFANDEDVRFLRGPETPLRDSDVVSIIPAMAGGR